MHKATLEGYENMSDDIAASAASWVLVSDIYKDFNNIVKEGSLREIYRITEKVKDKKKLSKEERKTLDNYNYSAKA